MGFWVSFSSFLLVGSWVRFFRVFYDFGCSFGFALGSFSLLFVKNLIILKKVVPPILNDSTVFLLHFGGLGPPGGHRRVKNRVSEFS